VEKSRGRTPRPLPHDLSLSAQVALASHRQRGIGRAHLPLLQADRPADGPTSAPPPPSGPPDHAAQRRRPRLTAESRARPPRVGAGAPPPAAPAAAAPPARLRRRRPHGPARTAAARRRRGRARGGPPPAPCPQSPSSEKCALERESERACPCRLPSTSDFPSRVLSSNQPLDKSDSRSGLGCQALFFILAAPGSSRGRARAHC